MYIGNSEIEKLYIGEDEVDKLYLGTDLIYEKSSGPDYRTMPLTFEILSGGTICWKANNSAYTVTLEYSKNGGEWTSITSNTDTSAPTIIVESGDKVQFRGNNATLATNSKNYNTFSGSTCGFKVKGNIMSLLYKDSFAAATTLQTACTFSNLFYNCTGLTDASELVLPATTLANRCYYAMFQDCISLTSAPSVLPATTLTNSCYNSMFYRCRSLTTALSILPATTLAENCYEGMFGGCQNLTSAPSILPATTLANSCYSSMFEGCTLLTTAPELPATTLPKNCYNTMFNKCTNLNYIKCLATDISAFFCTNNWVNGVASTGTFVKDATMTSWPSGASGIPTGWTVQDNV